jgi:hypothetical protein
MNLAPESLPLSVTPKGLRAALGWSRPGFLIRTAEGAWIVDVDPDNFDRDEMAEPFARLIAAAPDLLAALTMGAQVNTPDFLDWVADRLVNVYGESPNVDFVHSLRDRAKAGRAAIAKATGS